MKWYTYFICFILIIVGTFCGIQLYKEVKAESYINGSIDISNKFSQESFNYSSTSVIFYHDIYDNTDSYIFEIDLLKVEDFNGLEKEYQVVLNDYVLIDSQIKAGSVFSVVNMDFYNTDGELICNSNLNISIKFLSDKTKLTLSIIGNDDYTGLEQFSFFEQYFDDNGIRLKVIEIL